MTWMICPVCRGDGSHVNPNIDCQGLTREDFANDPDFAEDYFRGVYDVLCDCCDGSGKVRTEEWKDRQRELSDAADDRVTAAMEDGEDPSGLRDWRFGR